MIGLDDRAGSLTMVSRMDLIEAPDGSWATPVGDAARIAIDRSDFLANGRMPRMM
jgi:hypothetical protein